MTVNGAPIDDYTFRPAAATITYSMAYEMEQARIYAGMSIAEWDTLPGTQMWIGADGGRSKCDLIVLYRMSNAIPAAANDAQVRAQEIQAKRRGGR